MEVEDKEGRGIPRRVASDETSEGRTGIPETRMFLKEAPATVGLPLREKEGKEVCVCM